MDTEVESTTTTESGPAPEAPAPESAASSPDLPELPLGLAPDVAAKLKELGPGTYCQHRSWGFGQIKEWDVDEGKVIIDFVEKAGHPMQFEYAAESLTPLPDDHILALKARDLEALQQQAESEPLEVVRCCIVSLKGGATAAGIQEVLSPDVVSADKWKKWWDSTKRALRKDGHYYLPTRKSEALTLLDAPSAMGEKALKSFDAAVGIKNILVALTQVQKFWADIKSDEVIDRVVNRLNDAIANTPGGKAHELVELAIGRDDFLETAGRPDDAGPLAVNQLAPAEADKLADLLDLLPSSKHAKLLDAVRTGRPEEWPDLFLSLLARANSRTADVVVKAFVAAGRGPEVKEAVNRLLRERNLTCDFLYWFCKNRPELFEDMYEPQLLVAILAVLERDQLSDIRRGTKLYELVLGDKELIAHILKDAPFEDVRDITRAIMLSPVFEELDERSLLAKIIKLYPDVQSMVVGEETGSEDATLIVSWDSLEKRRLELEEIVQRKIPENSKEIGIAREYGDLKENHEFKAAKEMQAVLMRRKAELESLLSRAEGTDFAGADTSAANVGTTVTVKDLDTGETRHFTILGAWDSDPASGVVSYLTPLARALLQKTTGDVVELPTGEEDDTTHKVRIEGVAAYAAG
ncbi:MAG: GreA/GreB family elongation factor [Verrucomicrobiota bacterium]